MNKVVVGFCGKLASGKTTLSQVLAKKLDFQMISFGDFVRNYTSAKGFDSSSRETLQYFGEKLISQWGYEGFCNKVLEGVDLNEIKGVVIDGIRHKEIYFNLRDLYRDKFLFVFIDVDESLRLNRMSKRDISPQGQNIILEQHSTEIQVEELKAYSNLTINNSESLDDNIVKLINFINERD
ncbi:AAA family ATPase [Bacillus hwajinpoensis]|uniref:AAA family ATPase n=1 Tax=Guptibacillus hwajinpoensis TaxID=208199 RepID=A0A845F5B9_9BACL|nr:AAA family ATPase [Pseudalkalibacillus hwajinpoensis]MYL65989.1 AAA family ATPase [Pseudalkalibacillus hwajinpoensis]